MDTSKIPEALRATPQWILWRRLDREGRETKIPVDARSGGNARTNDPETWTTFEVAHAALAGHAGLGFVFSADDNFLGIDLDGCRSDNGEVAAWAKEIISSFQTYAEVSPSGTGVKLFCCARMPDGMSGRKVSVQHMKSLECSKAPALEVYDRGRYFAVTGLRLSGPHEPQERQAQVDWLLERYFAATVEPAPADFRSQDAALGRARAYVATMDGAVSGQGGHNQTFHVACVLVLGFSLTPSDALAVLSEYSERCSPPWSHRELEHKIASAAKQPGPRGYLRDVLPQRWSSVRVPNYAAVAASAPKQTTLVEATQAYLTRLRDHGSSLIETGLPDLDYALGGGIEPGEMVIFAARPSHGKSAVALQCVHHWTALGMPCAIVSEEMSAHALGKRTLQFVTGLPDEHWRVCADALQEEVLEYARPRAPAYVIEGCGTVARAAAEIERLARDGVRAVVVDYAQLLQAPGKTRYEQTTNVSIALRQLASGLNVTLLVLAQMSRSIESRDVFIPHMSDLKETGQLEQDADVIVFLIWPWKIDNGRPKNLYQFFVGKNRNRAINQDNLECCFDPSRQTLRDSAVSSRQEAPFYSRGGEGDIPD